MKNDNTIKALDQDTLRGQGKLGWTEAGKLHSTAKRLSSTFDENEGKVRAKKDKVTCPVCKRKFRSNDGKIPEHTKPRHYTFSGQKKEICSQSIYGFRTPVIIENLESYCLNDITFNVGDKVAIWAGFGSCLARILGITKDADKLIEYTIKAIVKKNNFQVYFYFEGYDEGVESYFFGNGIIKS